MRISSEGGEMIDAGRVMLGHFSSTSEWTKIVFIERLSTIDRCGIDTWNIQTFRRGTLSNVPTGVFTRSKTIGYETWARSISTSS